MSETTNFLSGGEIDRVVESDSHDRAQTPARYESAGSGNCRKIRYNAFLRRHLSMKTKIWCNACLQMINATYFVFITRVSRR